jgi:rare lipoprotein A
MLRGRRGVSSCALVLALSGALGCAGAAPATARPASGARGPSASAPGFTDGSQRGRASYYSDKLAGRSTASGEPYDPRALTAAHRKLRFGTVVEVTRADGRRVQVRINDRGPFGGGDRIIDLSRAAAESLQMIREGVVDVTLRIVSAPPSK